MTKRYTKWARPWGWTFAMGLLVAATGCLTDGARPCRDESACPAAWTCAQKDSTGLGVCLAHGEDLDGGSSGGHDAGPNGRDGGSTGADGGSVTPDGGVGPGASTRPFAVGWSAACAVRDDAKLVCWGSNNGGQLGRTGVPFNGTGEPDVVPGLSAVTHVAAAAESACAVADGRQGRGVYCWGRGEGIRGLSFDDPDYPSDAHALTRVALPDALVQGAAQLEAVGRDGYCLIGSGEDVYCWGKTIPGENAIPPRLMSGLSGAETLVGTSLNTSGSVVCAREAGQMRCASRFTSVLEHAGCNTGDVASTCAGFAGTDALAIGARHVCRQSEGALMCAGDNAYGAVEPGGQDAELSWGAVPGLPAGGLTTLRASADATCGLTPDGAVWCWGRALWGATGQGADDGQTEPTALSVPAANALRGGGYQTCARTREGHIWCWGSARDQGWHTPQRVRWPG